MTRLKILETGEEVLVLADLAAQYLVRLPSGREIFLLKRDKGVTWEAADDG